MRTVQRLDSNTPHLFVFALGWDFIKLLRHLELSYFITKGCVV